MIINNREIREAIKDAGLKHWQVAEVYGIHEGNFSRLLRKELSPDQKDKVFQAIKDAQKAGV